MAVTDFNLLQFMEKNEILSLFALLIGESNCKNMLELCQVQKSYGGEKILDIPDLQLSEGVYWLRGVNGSGKTTLLRLLAGLLPFKGDVRVRNHSLRATPVAYRRMISWADAEPGPRVDWSV